MADKKGNNKTQSPHETTKGWARLNNGRTLPKPSKDTNTGTTKKPTIK